MLNGLLSEKGLLMAAFFGRLMVSESFLLKTASALSFLRFKRFWALTRICLCSLFMSDKVKSKNLSRQRQVTEKNLFLELLGVEELEIAWEGIKSVIQVYREKQIALKTELDRKPVVEKTKRDYETKAAELEALISSKKKNLSEVESELKCLQTVLDDLKNTKKQFENYDKEKRVIEGNIENLKQKLQREKEELGQAVAAEEVVKELENSIAQLPFLEDYIDHLTEKEKQELALSSYSAKLEEVKQLKKAVEDTAKDHEGYLEKEKLIADKLKERKNYEGAEASLTKAKKQLKQIAEEKISKQSNLRRILKKLQKR